jgi:hypothetical protein
MHFVKAPLPGSYVVVLPVIAGPYPGAPDEREAKRRLGRVMHEGCDFFLDLTKDGELEPYAHLLPGRVRHVRLPLRKGEVPAPARMREVVDTMNRASARDGYFLYVHDEEGVGRVGMAIGCWLTDTPVVGAGVLAFLDRLRSDIPQRRPSPDLPAQRAFVLGWTRGVEPAPFVNPAGTQAVLEGGMR